MIRIHKLTLIVFSLLLTFALPSHRVSAQNDAYVSYNDFYQDLAAYGQWIQDPQLGYVWSPTVDGDFRPYYTNGNWVMTNYGNTWVSNYPWGWACFHYGRWTYDAYYGWLWIPGSDWGPAWVSWRYGEGNYGWAPLGPGYDLSSNYGDYSCPNDWWVFIPPQYLYTGNYYRYWYGPRGNNEIIGNTAIVNNVYTNNNVTYVSGPRSSDIEHITSQPVQVYNLASSSSLNTRVHNNVVKMYRPAQIRSVAVNSNGERVAPPNVINVTQPVSRPQSVNGTQAAHPAFKNNIPGNNKPADAVGTNAVEAQKVTPPATQRSNTRPYEWDVNKPVPQPQARETQENHAPQQTESRSQPQQSRPAQAVPQQRSAPMPQQQPSRPAPMPQQAPAPRVEERR